MEFTKLNRHHRIEISINKYLFCKCDHKLISKKLKCFSQILNSTKFLLVTIIEFYVLGVHISGFFLSEE